MTCDRITTGQILAGMMTASNPRAAGGAIIGGASADDVAGDGEIAIFRFTAKKDLAELNFDIINLSLTDAKMNAIPVVVRNTASSGESTATETGEPAKTETEESAETKATDPATPVQETAAVTSTASFADVDSGAYYAKAVS